MFCPGVAFDLKNRSPTVQVPGRLVPTLAGLVLAAPLASCLPVKVFVRPIVATVAELLGPVNVTPFAIVSTQAEQLVSVIPFTDLLVNASMVALPTTVSVASGKVQTRVLVGVPVSSTYQSGTCSIDLFLRL